MQGHGSISTAICIWSWLKICMATVLLFAHDGIESQSKYYKLSRNINVTQHTYYKSKWCNIKSSHFGPPIMSVPKLYSLASSAAQMCLHYKANWNTYWQKRILQGFIWKGTICFPQWKRFSAFNCLESNRLYFLQPLKCFLSLQHTSTFLSHERPERRVSFSLVVAWAIADFASERDPMYNSVFLQMKT